MYHNNTEQTKPTHLADIVSKDLEQRISVYHKVRSDSALIDRVFTKTLSSEDLTKLLKQPFYINAFEDGKLLFWNNNRIFANCDSLSDNTINSAAVLGKNIFFTACDTVAGNGHTRTISLVIPLALIYPFENEYLKSHWVSSNVIPPTTEVSQHYVKGYLPVEYAKGKIAFYIHFIPDDLHNAPPGSKLVWVFVGGLVFIFIWLHLLALHFSKGRSPLLGLGFILAVVLVLRISLSVFGLPFQLQELDLFLPQLYSSSAYLPSLGELLIDTVFVTWIVSFIFTNTPYKSFFKNTIPAPARYALSLVFISAMLAYCYYFIHVIQTVVVDSMISFDVGVFFNSNIYSVTGFFTIVLIACISALIIHLLSEQVKSLIPQSWLRYLLLAIAGLAYIMLFFDRADGNYPYVVLCWLLLFTMLLDIKRLHVSPNLLSPHMIFWAVFICLSTTVLLQYFSQQKEKETRKAFAARLVRQRDPMTQYLFQDVAYDMIGDEKIVNFLKKPSQAGRNNLNEHIDVMYLKGHLNKYQTEIYFFDAAHKALYNPDTTNFSEFESRVATGVPVADSFLFFKEDAQDGHYYLARIPVRNDSDGHVAGYAFIDMATKKANNETVYPELLLPGNLGVQQHEEDYDYAIYYNRNLITQNGDYSFLLNLPPKAKPVNDTRFVQNDSVSELWYKADARYDVIVVHNENALLGIVTLLSYLLTIQLLLALIVSTFRLFFQYFSLKQDDFRFVLFTLRRRIHYAMLGVVMVSFLLIGIITYYFSNAKYTQSNRDRLNSILKVVENTIQRHIANHNGFASNTDYENEVSKSEFRYFITNLAAQQRIDINVYNKDGRLLTTSQEDIYKKALQARLMRAGAYQRFMTENVSLLMLDEKVGELQYLSSYMPLRSNNGELYGFVNIPYFASQKEINSQVSNLLVVLINIYALIFLLSSIIAVFITGSLTASLNVIINKFKNLSLQKNELIEWKHDDEIGLLVAEYNKMVRKVEEQAAQQAENERETAWREMARQVAHEIKNPLTPMKLNIQYLQQALKQDKPNVKELTERVAESLIEQIDNLNYIASEFSTFAKLPEAKAEEVELNELLASSTQLYVNDEGVKIAFEKFDSPVKVTIDRSQLMRVCTNLLQNAAQAIPDDQQGNITVKLEVDDTQHAIISVKDNGIGIPAEIRDKLFKPYFTTKSSGTGLGLAMTKKIIEFWEGTIWFESREGKGTTFFIKLPLI